MKKKSFRVPVGGGGAVLWVAIILLILLTAPVVSPQDTRSSQPGVRVVMPPADEQRSDHHHRRNQVIVDNGILQAAFSVPEGHVTGIKYNGIENVLDSELLVRGYWDVVWHEPKADGIFDKLEGTRFKVVTQNEDQVELSFTRTWNSSHRGSAVPLNVDKRYIIRRGSSGIYMYGIFERLEGWPDIDMDQFRIVFKLNPDKFRYMAVSDDRQRYMPREEDRDIKSGRAQPLAYKEAVLLVNPRNAAFRGEVDDKYMYSTEDSENQVHGWISREPGVGFWMITPSDEFRCGGPVKQDLTSHVGPITLSMFTSTHYAGNDMDMAYRNGEPWKKVFGPVFLYLNSAPAQGNPGLSLWDDAKRQMRVEVRSWPYHFVQSEDFPLAHQRGTVSGQLRVRDRYVNRNDIAGGGANVGLAAPGEVGSWQTESKGYQFWTRADSKGRFLIRNIRPGNYSLYGWVSGFIGDYRYNKIISISPGAKVDLGTIVYEPPRTGPTLWEIGIPDRKGGEFFIPDPYPTLTNRLYEDGRTNKFRQYGLWDRYADLYPRRDLVFDVSSSDFTKHWFFAQVTRRVGNRTYMGTTWRVLFDLPQVDASPNARYTLRLALAAANMAEVQVWFNQPFRRELRSTGYVGKDNAIARHGIHGLYHLYSFDVPNSWLRVGRNTMYLRQPRAVSPFQGVMYDYIRLEGPSRA